MGLSLEGGGGVAADTQTEAVHTWTGCLQGHSGQLSHLTPSHLLSFLGAYRKIKLTLLTGSFTICDLLLEMTLKGK